MIEFDNDQKPNAVLLDGLFGAEDLKRILRTLEDNAALRTQPAGAAPGVDGRMVFVARLRTNWLRWHAPAHSVAPGASVAACTERLKALYGAHAVLGFDFIDGATLAAPPLFKEGEQT